MSELFKLENDALCVEINALGAEMKRIFSKTLKLDLLWRGDELVWGRSAPILFPIVGKLIDNEYIYQGKTYSMNQHGFARDNSFSCVKQTSTELELIMKATQETFAAYPFCFDLKVIYKLDGNTLKVSHVVVNDDRQDILFSIGAHPGFKTANLSDYEIDFEAIEAGFYRLKDGKVDWNKQYLLNSQKIPLSMDLFTKDALIFRNINSKFVDLKNKQTGEVIRVHSDAPYWGIWGKGNVPFVCIEPWYGVADIVGHDKKLAHKEGMIRLEQKKSFVFSYSLEFMN